MLIDTHCHLDFSAFDSDRDLVIAACQKQNITSIVVPGVCSKHWQRILLLCRTQDILYPALGLHPCFLSDHKAEDLDQLAQICARQSVDPPLEQPLEQPIVAIGEIGLDYYKGKNKVLNKELQRWYFSKQLEIAGQYHLPVLIHARKSHQDVLQYLKTKKSITGIIHAYSGSYEQAKEYLNLGFKLGFGGAYTYPKATKLRALLAKLPLEAWVLETDAPDMSPVMYHQQRNSPQYIPQIAEEFVNLYNAEINIKSDTEELICQLNKNTHEVLSLI